MFCNYQKLQSVCAVTNSTRTLLDLPLRLIGLVLLVASFTCVTSYRADAQAVSATLLGSVNDKTGAAIANATVTIRDVATGSTHQVTTNESGNYTFPNLPPGAYSVTAEANGFKKETRSSVDVIVNSTTRVDLGLEPGSASETVTVTDVPPMLQTDRADVSTKLEAQHIEDMPLSVNRNFQGLLNIVPGTSPATFQHSQFFNAQSSLQTQVNGLPRMGNSYQIEGIDDDERTGLLQIMIPPADAIQTVDVSTNNYEAELGRATGAVTNVTLKSGSNAFHGSAEEYLQNSALDARSYFSKSVGHVAYNYFGGNFSGPIIKNRLFFYGDYFHTSDHEANSNTLTIPFQQYYTPNTAGNIDLSPLLKSNGQGQIYDPDTTQISANGAVTRTPFPNNQIPANRVNPVSAALMALLPAPNQNLTSLSSPSNNYFATLPFQKSANTYDAKIDWQITEKDHLSGRYSYQSVTTFQAPVFGPKGGGPAQGGFQGTGKQNAYSIGANYDRAFSPTLLTEARVGVAHYRSDAQPSDYGSNDAEEIGIPGVNISQFTSGQVGIFLPDFTGNPLIGYSASVPWIRGEANIDFANHWTKIIGNHTIKFGGDLRRVRDDLLQDQTFSPRGAITFSEGQTSQTGSQTNIANEMASFLLDVPSTVGRDLNTYFPAYRQWWLFAFGGDKWQVTPKLTVDLGLRWEFYPPATPKSSGGFSNYDPTTNSLVIAGVGGNPSNLGMETRYRYFAPRTGFAYRVSDMTVVRGGFGISYMPFPDNTYAYNYPVRANNSYQPTGAASAFTPAVLANGETATFQAGFPAPVPIDIPSSGIISASTPQLLSQVYTVIPKNFKNPYVEAWNVAVQQALPAQLSLQISYVANHGVDIAAQQNINLAPALGLGAAGLPENIAFKRTAATNQFFLGFSSNYQSLQLQLTRRFINGLALTSAFTWGKGLGYQNGDDGGLTFWLDQRHNYAPNDYDRTLNYEQTFTYELPFGHGKRWLQHGVVSNVLGGWKLSGLISVLSGTPFTITASGSSISTSGQQQTANMNKPFHVLHGIGSGNNWFDPTSFSQPVGCTGTPCPIKYGVTMGNTGRNQFRGPGYIQDNFSAFKSFRIRETVSLETRCDAFQLSNTPQFNNPSNSITSTTFGQVTGTLGSGAGAVNAIGGGRALQLAGIIRF